MRVCFVGQRHYFDACRLEGPAGGLVPAFVDHRGGEDPRRMLAEVAAARPDVVVVFRPEIVPPGGFDGLGALVLGFATEPIPRTASGRPHPDLRGRLAELAATDASQFDRLVSFDPLGAEVAESVGVRYWRSRPLPVADGLFADAVRPPVAGRRPLFLGYSTKHREAWLIEAKHHLDLLHVAHGVHGAARQELFAQHDVAVNLHAEAFPSFENRVLLHLAAGHLVLSEPLSPLHGLEPGIDHVEVRHPSELLRTLLALRAHPGMLHAVRVRGHAKAQAHRASRVWPRLVADLVADVAAYGGRGERAGGYGSLTARTQSRSS